MFRHKKLLHFRNDFIILGKIKHICFLKKVNFRILTLNHIRSQEQFSGLEDL